MDILNNNNELLTIDENENILLSELIQNKSSYMMHDNLP